jgi:hypothetical protein
VGQGAFDAAWMHDDTEVPGNEGRQRRGSQLGLCCLLVA